MFSKNTFVVALLLCSCTAYIFQDYSVISRPSVHKCKGCKKNTVTGNTNDTVMIMSGSTVIDAQPDQAILNAKISASGITTENAVNALAVLNKNVIGILNKNQLTENDYKTTSFNTFPNRTSNKGVWTVVGQVASQSFQVTIPQIDSSGSKIGKLIDDLATVNGIVLNGLSFDLSNKTAVHELARS